MSAFAHLRSRGLRLPAWAPFAALGLVLLVSLFARVYKLDEPCQSPCTTADAHTLIFDEAYYVNAAKVVAGIHPPAGAHYDESPLGTDPNAEHPQGAKLVVAAAIKLFGDGPFAWRIGSVIFALAAILGMFALVRGCGGGEWSAVGAASLMALDNLMIVHGRIATLDIYALAPMVWGVAMYMRGRPSLAALLLGLADCFKEVAPYALIVLGLLELGRTGLRARDASLPDSWRWRPTVIRWLITSVGSAAVFILGLWAMGLIATPYADAEHLLITGGPFAHLWHMVTYAEALTNPHGATGIASYPWQWLVDLKPITYLRINPSLPGQGLDAIRPVCAFLGMVSPPILALGEPALLVCGWRALRSRGSGRSPQDTQLALLAVAWFIGTWGPYQLQSALDSRTSYLYYMVSVMPGIYLAAAYACSLLWRLRRGWLRSLVVAWGLTVVAAAILMYPFVAAF